MRSTPNEKKRERKRLDDAPDIVAAVEACRANEDLLEKLREIYRDIDGEMASLGARCMGGGACCKFDVAGHELYVSTGELGLLTGVDPPFPDRLRAGRCPYQIGPRCTARDRRPLGCRIFFCDPRLTDSLRACYESYHRRIKSAHQSCWAPYAYMELTSCLLQLFSTE